MKDLTSCLRSFTRILLFLLLLAGVTTGAAPAQVSGSTRPFDAAAFSKTFTHRYATVNGVRLHYVIGGAGDPLVLIHGYPETWYAWRKVMPSLAQHYTVIAPDMPGLGDSGNLVGAYDERAVADCLYGLVHQLGYTRIFLAGADMGALPAYAYAAAHPQEVRKLVFMESALPGYGLEQAEDVTHGGQWYFGFFQSPKFPEMLTAGHEREFLDALAYKGSTYIPTAITSADVDEYVSHYAASGGMKAGFDYYRAFPEDSRLNHEYARTKLLMPVLALGTDHSISNLCITTMQAVATNVQGEIIRNCGHWIAEEQPDELTRQMLVFFSAGKRSP